MGGSALAGRLLAPQLNIKVERYMQVGDLVITLLGCVFNGFNCSNLLGYGNTLPTCMSSLGGCSGICFCSSDMLCPQLLIMACLAQVVFAVSAAALFVPVIFNTARREEMDSLLADAPGQSPVLLSLKFSLH